MSSKAGFLAAMGANTLIGTTLAISAPNTTTDAMTATAHGKITGFGPVRLVNSGGALPTGLAAATDYWLIVVDANTVKFASSYANAVAGTAVDITAAGSGTHTMQATMTCLADMMSNIVTNHLTFPGNKDQSAAVNIDTFWRDATFAPFPIA